MAEGPNEDLLNDQLGASTFAKAQDSLPERAQVIVIGGGIVGSSVAYHLVRLGVPDVLVIEQSRLSAGSTWHAAGLIANVRPSHALTELASYGVDLYSSLEEEVGIDIGFNQCGALSLAQTIGRDDELRHTAMVGRHHGIEVHELPPDGIRDLWPLASLDGLVRAYHHPRDGTVNPGWATVALAKGAHERGAKIVEAVQVERLLQEGRRVVGVETDCGRVEAESVALCAGMWSRELAAGAGVSLPLWPAEHIHVTTGEVDGAGIGLPVLRDFDGWYYVRSHKDRLMVGAFEPNGKPRPMSTMPDRFAFGEFEPDWDHFEPIRKNAAERVPALDEASYQRFLCAPESFTPDTTFLLGETAELSGLFTAAGFNSQGIIFGPGAGRALAEWIVEGAATFDAAEVDCSRFARSQDNPRYLNDRTREGLGRVFGMHWPHLQPKMARNVRRTPLHERIAAAGACFGEANGWERANWYAPKGVEPVDHYSFRRPNWFDYVAEEHRAARERVAIFDLSSFAKIEVQGSGACEALQRICTQDVDVELGRVVYTLFCNQRGGIELDGTVTRLGEHRFLVLTPGVAQHKTLNWIRRFAGAEAEVGIFDATSAFATLAVMGPESRSLLSAISPSLLDHESFRWGRAREIDVADARALALRISFVGELGWELYVPTEYAVNVYDALIAAGREFGLRHAGYHALDSLRLEKGYRHLGHDIGPGDDPYQADLAFAVSLTKGSDFEGRASLERLAEQQASRKQVFVRLEDPEPTLIGAETIRCGGKVAGHLTSANYGYTIGAAIGMGYADANALDEREVEVGVVDGTWEPATMGTTPFYDPESERLRGPGAGAKASVG